MNFIPCRLVEKDGGLAVQLSDRLSLAIPESRVARYRPYTGQELIFGLRPEHIIEKRGEPAPGTSAFTVQLDVVEPMGMETMAYFIIHGLEVCGRVNPAAAATTGQTMPLVPDLNHMLRIDTRTHLMLSRRLSGSKAPLTP